MLIKQISVFIENKPGRLAEITDALARTGIEIRAFSIADTADFGILRLIVNDPEKALSALKENMMTVSVTKVIGAQIEDRSGSLNRVLQTLFDKGISVEYAYAFITRRENNAFVILRVENNEEAVSVLEKAGIKLLDPSEVYSI
ncbi:MAG: ACT domain-containing protein [Bacillota bacterium]|nr:ACT domain-containing protein [Bacillota bacterium]